MKRVLVIICIIAGVLTIAELIIPGHLSLLMAYFTGIIDLFTSNYGTPKLPG